MSFSTRKVLTGTLIIAGVAAVAASVYLMAKRIMPNEPKPKPNEPRKPDEPKPKPRRSESLDILEFCLKDDKMFSSLFKTISRLDNVTNTRILRGTLSPPYLFDVENIVLFECMLLKLNRFSIVIETLFVQDRQALKDIWNSDLDMLGMQQMSEREVTIELASRGIWLSATTKKALLGALERSKRMRLRELPAIIASMFVDNSRSLETISEFNFEDLCDTIPSNDVYMTTLNDRLRAIAKGVAGAIPVVGGTLKSLINVVWPSSGVDVFGQIKGQIEQLIEYKLFESNLERFAAKFRTLKEKIQQYVNATASDRRIKLESALTIALSLEEDVEHSKDRMFLIQFLCVLSHIHLSLLNEQFMHGEELYKESNYMEWLRQLKKSYNNYTKAIEDSFAELYQWRKSMITYRDGPWYTAYADKNKVGHIVDAFTKEEYYCYLDSLDPEWSKLVGCVTTRLTNEHMAKYIISVVSASFSLCGYVPGLARKRVVASQAFSVISLGPYSEPTLFINHDRDFEITTPDSQGHICKIDVGLHNNSVTFLQVHFQDHVGVVHGYPANEVKTIGCPDTKHIIGLSFRFDKKLRSISAFYSDGSESEEIGDANASKKITAKIEKYYELIRVDTGKDSAGITAISLKFGFRTGRISLS